MTVVARPHRRTRLLLAAVVLALVATFVQVQSTPAEAHTGEHVTLEKAFLKKINNAREAWCVRQGRGPRCIDQLKMAGDGYPIRDHSQAWSRTMALAGTISHGPGTPTLMGSLGYAWGENVGNGVTVRQIHKMLMQSPCHKANILSLDNLCPIYLDGGAIMDRRWEKVAIGVEERLIDGFVYIFVTQIFYRT